MSGTGPAADGALRRDIGLLGSAFLAFNGLVGAGIFVLPGTLAERFGAFSPFAFPLFGLLALVIALPFARIAGHHPLSGGPVVYAAPFGPFIAFQAGWLYYVARATALAANLNVLVAYAAGLWPVLGTGPVRAALILAVIVLVCAVNVAGVRRAVRLVDAMTLLKAAPLVLLALAALVMAAPDLSGLLRSVPVPPAVPPLAELNAAALLTLYAFVGFENSVVAAGETRRPGRTLPRALIGTVVLTALVYTLIQAAYLAVMGTAPAGAAGGDAPMIAFGRAVWGEAGAMLLTIAAIASVTGNVAAGVTGSARTTYAMGRDGLLPRWFAAVDPRFATPARSIWFMGAFIAVLALTGGFAWLAVASVLARMIIYALSIAALPRAEPGRAGIWALTLAGIATCGWVAAQSGAGSWQVLGVLGGAGMALYLVARRERA